jgi:hypothetical protein
MPIGLATLKAECDFGRSIGKITFSEHFENEQSSLKTSNSAYIAANARRYLRVNMAKNSLNRLCPLSTYTFSIHQYNNTECKCKKVGPLMLGSNGIIAETIVTGRNGQLSQAYESQKRQIKFSLLPT